MFPIPTIYIFGGSKLLNVELALKHLKASLDYEPSAMFYAVYRDTLVSQEALEDCRSTMDDMTNSLGKDRWTTISPQSNAITSSGGQGVIQSQGGIGYISVPGGKVFITLNLSAIAKSH